MTAPTRLLPLAILLSAVWGCAKPQVVRTAAPTPQPAPRPPLSAVAGVWDWVQRSQNDQGDLRIEQEEWHLTQQGERLSGYYDRQVVVLSTDQHPFRCNNSLGFTRNTRVRLAGQVRAGQVLIRETAADSPPHPCDSGERKLMNYVGQLQGDSLMLQFSLGGTQFLSRRAPGVQMPSIGTVQATASPSQPLSGVWEWELSTVDADGDLRTEREEWHLTESEAELSGYYERSVTRQRPGGAFSCNNAPAVRTVTHYTVRGQRFGSRVSLSEVDYKAQPNPCDNAMRRLDSYRGEISPTGGEIVLSWGSGSQLLRKR